jgi:hypothetical protein
MSFVHSSFPQFSHFQLFTTPNYNLGTIHRRPTKPSNDLDLHPADDIDGFRSQFSQIVSNETLLACRSIIHNKDHNNKPPMIPNEGTAAVILHCIDLFIEMLLYPGSYEILNQITFTVPQSFDQVYQDDIYTIITNHSLRSLLLQVGPDNVVDPSSFDSFVREFRRFGLNNIAYVIPIDVWIYIFGTSTDSELIRLEKLFLLLTHFPPRFTPLPSYQDNSLPYYDNKGSTIYTIPDLIKIHLRAKTFHNTERFPTLFRQSIVFSNEVGQFLSGLEYQRIFSQINPFTFHLPENSPNECFSRPPPPPVVVEAASSPMGDDSDDGHDGHDGDGHGHHTNNNNPMDEYYDNLIDTDDDDNHDDEPDHPTQHDDQQQQPQPNPLNSNYSPLHPPITCNTQQPFPTSCSTFGHLSFVYYNQTRAEFNHTKSLLATEKLFDNSIASTLQTNHTKLWRSQAVQRSNRTQIYPSDRYESEIQDLRDIMADVIEPALPQIEQDEQDDDNNDYYGLGYGYNHPQKPSKPITYSSSYVIDKIAKKIRVDEKFLDLTSTSASAHVRPPTLPVKRQMLSTLSHNSTHKTVHKDFITVRVRYPIDHEGNFTKYINLDDFNTQVNFFAHRDVMVMNWARFKFNPKQFNFNFESFFKHTTRYLHFNYAPDPNRFLFLPQILPLRRPQQENEEPEQIM